MLVGYGRSSTLSQKAGLDDQLAQLLATGCNEDAIYLEMVSSVAVRDKLREALAFVRAGDVLCVTRVDRLARSTTDLLSIINLLENKKVGLRILDFGGAAVDTQSPSGRLIVTMLAAMAEFERALILDRMRCGIERARREGKYKGRQPLPPAKVAAVKALRASGKGASVIANEVGISRASVYRIIGEARQ